jgi:hypothetical protein
MKKIGVMLLIVAFLFCAGVSTCEAAYYVDANGIVKEEGKIVGKITGTGDFADLDGNVLGYLDADGVIKGVVVSEDVEEGVEEEVEVIGDPGDLVVPAE